MPHSKRSMGAPARAPITVLLLVAVSICLQQQAAAYVDLEEVQLEALATNPPVTNWLLPSAADTHFPKLQKIGWRRIGQCCCCCCCSTLAHTDTLQSIHPALKKQPSTRPVHPDLSMGHSPTTNIESPSNYLPTPAPVLPAISRYQVVDVPVNSGQRLC